MVIINDSSCVNCGLCQRICPSGAICLINHSIDQRLCLECYHCVAVCQSNAITNGLLPPVEAVDFFPRRNELKNLILQRRSVRNYSSRKPETDLLQSFISDLRYSPTASNAQSLCSEPFLNNSNHTFPFCAVIFFNAVNPSTLFMIANI